MIAPLPAVPSASPSAPFDTLLSAAGVTPNIAAEVDDMAMLRLLAREVYNKVSARAGAENVALITGEEKIKPKNPRFWVATVEAMPRDLDVAFVAIDEIQLGSDLDRGHVFTDRMLNRRGREETMVLGAATVRPMVERLLPGASIITRPRMSVIGNITRSRNRS